MQIKNGMKGDIHESASGLVSVGRVYLNTLAVYLSICAEYTTNRTSRATEYDMKTDLVTTFPKRGFLNFSLLYEEFYLVSRFIADVFQRAFIGT